MTVRGAATPAHTPAATPADLPAGLSKTPVVGAAAKTAVDMSGARSARRRATCRAVGQIALIVTLAVGLVSHAQDVIRCVSPDEMDRAVCGWLVTRDALPFTAMGVLTMVLAAVGLWATLRHSAGRVWTARACAVGLAAPMLVVLVWALVTEPDSLAGWGNPWGTVVSLEAAVAPWALLAASYHRARSHQAGSTPVVADERGVAGWLGVLVSVIGLIVAIQALERAVELPPIGPLVYMLAAGAGYGVLRWLRPLPGAGHWLPATLILTVLLVPTYTWLRWAIPYTDGFPSEIARVTIAWALTLTSVAVLGVLHLARSRRSRPHIHPEDHPEVHTKAYTGVRAPAGAVAAWGDTPDR
jgi:hypothetical protein